MALTHDDAILIGTIGALWSITVALVGAWGKNVVDQLKGINATLGQSVAEQQGIIARQDAMDDELKNVRSTASMAHRRLDQHIENHG
jgi:hypothetical protein